jgi:hypothetical protein
MSVVNRQGVKDTRLEGEVAPEFSTNIVFPPDWIGVGEGTVVSVGTGVSVTVGSGLDVSEVIGFGVNVGVGVARCSAEHELLFLMYYFDNALAYGGAKV